VAKEVADTSGRLSDCLTPDLSAKFVMSTCDQQVRDLARQKCRHLGRRAKLYISSALGASRPVIADDQESQLEAAPIIT